MIEKDNSKVKKNGIKIYRIRAVGDEGIEVDMPVKARYARSLPSSLLLRDAGGCFDGGFCLNPEIATSLIHVLQIYLRRDAIVGAREARQPK